MDMSATSAERFVPAAPARPPGLVPVWRTFFGEMASNPVAACGEASFRELYVTRRFLKVTYHGVNDPEGIKRILLDNQSNYIKPRLLAQALPPLAGGLFGADAEAWRSQRRLMAPVFTPGAVADFMPIFTEVGRQTAEAWTPGLVDVARSATAATFDIIGRALFSSDHGLSSEEAADHVAGLLADAARPKLSILVGGRGFGGDGPGARALAFLSGRIGRFIAARQADPDPPFDFMTRLVAAFAAEHSPEEAARLALSNAITFLLAGHETTANALAWTLYLLSEQPQVQTWAAEEAQVALSAGGSAPEILERLVYLRWVLDEAMRLYPPAPRIEREAAHDDEIGPLRVRKGDLVGIWPWVVHRHKALWDDPDGFDAERFTPEARAAQHRFQYIPFGAGPRVCIGAQFATAEALLILVQWLARYSFAPMPGRNVQVASDIALRPKGGLPLIVAPR